jgi:hypothetical protein
MAAKNLTSGGSPGNISCIFAVANIVPPGIPTSLRVGEENGDITIAVDLMDHLIGSLILTRAQALDLSIALCAAVMNIQRRQESE